MLKITVPYYLGIDGGGTKTLCAVGDEAHVLATAASGPSNIIRVGEAAARESMSQAVRQACAAAGITPAQVSHACAGAAGAARPEIAEIVRDALAEILSSREDKNIIVVGDMQIALEAAFDAGPGVIVIAGTGSIAYGRDAHGNTARAGGWGFAISDEGSAHWIGRAAVSAILRVADEAESNLAARTALLASSYVRALFKAWGVNSFTDLARAANAIPPPDFAKLSPIVCAAQDAFATEILTRSGRELAHLAAVVVRHLFAAPAQVTVPVAMTGGVFRHAPSVRQVFYNELRQLEPRAQVNPQVVEPVEGALRLARTLAAKSC